MVFPYGELPEVEIVVKACVLTAVCEGMSLQPWSSSFTF